MYKTEIWVGCNTVSTWLCAPTIFPIHLCVLQASPEWKAGDPLPIGAASGALDGVVLDQDLFPSTAAHAVAGTAASPAVSGVLGTASMQRSVATMQAFTSSFVQRPDLASRLHGPVLGGGTTTESLPVKQLRQFVATAHLRSGASIADILSRLPCVSAAGLAGPAADRLVRPELAGVYDELASRVAALSGRLHGAAAGLQQAAAGPQLRLMHYSQVCFGRLDVAWDEAVRAAAVPQ
jgi:hypothetical protein